MIHIRGFHLDLYFSVFSQKYRHYIRLYVHTYKHAWHEGNKYINSATPVVTPPSCSQNLKAWWNHDEQKQSSYVMKKYVNAQSLEIPRQRAFELPAKHANINWTASRYKMCKMNRLKMHKMEMNCMQIALHHQK